MRVTARGSRVRELGFGEVPFPFDILGRWSRFQGPYAASSSLPLPVERGISQVKRACETV